MIFDLSVVLLKNTDIFRDIETIMDAINNYWKDIHHVVFDWNGTLIDDLNLAVQSVNHVRTKMRLEPITREAYRANFRFPIADFYAAIGFDFEQNPFPDIVAEYLSVFDTRVKHCALHAGSAKLISNLHTRGIGVSVLSASRRAVLIETIRAKGLIKYLTHICGLEEAHAVGKLQEAAALNDRLGLQPHQILYVGDTDHDAYIAQTLGWQARMLLCGHQDEAPLSQFPYPRLSDVSALLDSFAAAIPTGIGRGSRAPVSCARA